MALYAKDQTMVLVLEDQREQEEWYLAMKKLMEEELMDEEQGEGLDEEDDGYCTLPPAAFLKEVRRDTHAVVLRLRTILKMIFKIVVLQQWAFNIIQWFSHCLIGNHPERSQHFK